MKPASPDTRAFDGIVQYRVLGWAVLHLPFDAVDRILRREYAECDMKDAHIPLPPQPVLRGYVSRSASGHVMPMADWRLLVKHETVEAGRHTVISIRNGSKLIIRATAFTITAVSPDRTKVTVDTEEWGLALGIDSLYENARMTEIIELLRREARPPAGCASPAAGARS